MHYEAMAQEKLLRAQVLGSPDGKRRGGLGADATGGVSIPDRITIANARKAEARRRRRRQRGKRTHWLEPTLATTMAVSFALPGWIVDYFRLVRMEARVDVPVADPPAASSSLDGITEGFPLVLFSHSFTGMKEQNSSLLQELASWGHIVVAVDHPHDAALVLYPDGSTADFRGYDMPMESEPRNWWRFRHEHARWRALDLRARAREDRGRQRGPRQPAAQEGGPDARRRGGALVRRRRVSDARADGPEDHERRADGPVDVAAGQGVDGDAGAPCPLLVLEAPEFLWDRDIFCVNNGEMSSLLCAATAPQCAGVRPRSEPPTPSKTPRPSKMDSRRISDGSVRFDDMIGDDGREHGAGEDDGEEETVLQGLRCRREGAPPAPPERARWREPARGIWRKKKNRRRIGRDRSRDRGRGSRARARPAGVHRRVRGRVQGRRFLHRGRVLPRRVPARVADVRARGRVPAASAPAEFQPG